LAPYLFVIVLGYVMRKALSHQTPRLSPNLGLGVAEDMAGVMPLVIPEKMTSFLLS
jgi:hypothetical protein